MRTFLHIPERRVAEAVGTQRVAFAPGPGGPQDNLKVIQGTAELLVQLDGSVLGEAVGLIAVGAVEPAGLGLQAQVHVRWEVKIVLSILMCICAAGNA